LLDSFENGGDLREGEQQELDHVDPLGPGQPELYVRMLPCKVHSERVLNEYQET